MALFSKIVTKVFGKKSDKDIKKVLPVVAEINEEYNKLISLSDDDLKNRALKVN